MRNRLETLANKKPVVLLLGPQRSAVSGVSTHLNMLMASDLAQKFLLRHFQVGSEGRGENPAGRRLRLLASPFRLAFRLFAEQVDIVHLNTSLNRRAYWRDLVYMLVARLSGARVLYQVHGGDLPEQFSGPNRLLKFLLRSSLRLAETIVVLARCECEAYLTFTKGLRISLLPNAVDCAPYLTLDRHQASERQPLRLIYVGRLSREKGLFDALSALKLSRLAGSQAHLLIAGSGPDEDALRQRVGELQLADAVTFAGPVFGEDKIRVLGEADVLLFPTYAEGLPYALLEGMAAGLPAITTRVGAIPDVVIDNVHGIFVMPRDVQAISRAINRLAGNPSLVARMGAACRERIKSRYTIQRMADEFSRLYSEMGTRGGGRAAVMSRFWRTEP